MPRPQVGPSEVTLHDIHVIAVFQDGIVYRQVGIARIVLCHVLQLLVITVFRLLKLQVAQHTGEDALKTLCQLARVDHKDARIPVELATLHKHLGKLALRLLSERVHRVQIGLATQVTHLDITIAGLRTRRLHTHRQQHVVLGDITQTRLQTTHELSLVDHQLVRGRDNDVGIWLAALDAHIGPRHAGCRIAVHRLHQDVTLIHFGHLLLHQRQILLTRTDKYILKGDDLQEAIKGCLQLCTPYAKEINKLLRTVLTTARPQSETLSSR